MKVFCEKDLCELNHAFHCDKLIFFDRDKRQESQTSKKIILKYRFLIVNDEETLDVLFFFTIVDNKYFLIEDFVQEISSNIVVNRRFDIAFSRN